MTHALASVSVSQSFQNLLDTVFHSIPKILVFLAILVVGWIIAKVVMRVIVALLRRTGFDRFAERGVVGQAGLAGLSREPHRHFGQIARHTG
jgi:Conserved TM helix